MTVRRTLCRSTIRLEGRDSEDQGVLHARTGHGPQVRRQLLSIPYLPYPTIPTVTSLPLRPSQHGQFKQHSDRDSMYVPTDRARHRSHRAYTVHSAHSSAAASLKPIPAVPRWSCPPSVEEGQLRSAYRCWSSWYVYPLSWSIILFLRGCNAFAVQSTSPPSSSTLLPRFSSSRVMRRVITRSNVSSLVISSSLSVTMRSAYQLESVESLVC